MIGLVSSSCFAGDLYVSGYSQVIESDKPRIGGGVAVGYDMGLYRLEAEAGYQGGITSVIMNGFYERRFGKSDWSMYTGTGIGVAVISSRTSFVYQTMAGIGYHAFDNLVLSGGYKVFTAESVNIHRDSINYSTRSVVLAVRYKF